MDWSNRKLIQKLLYGLGIISMTAVVLCLCAVLLESAPVAYASATILAVTFPTAIVILGKFIEAKNKIP